MADHIGSSDASLRWLHGFMASIVFAGMVACDSVQQKGEEMTEQVFLQKLRDSDSSRRHSLDGLVAEVKQGSREKVQWVVNAWLGSDPEIVSKAAYILGSIEDPSIGPLLEVPDPPDASRRVWLLESLVENELLLRNRIVSRLEPLLLDKTFLPDPPMTGPVEEPAPSRRVNDVAYGLLRRLLSLDESPEQYHMNMEAFYHLPIEERDREIREARTSREWVQLIEAIDQ